MATTFADIQKFRLGVIVIASDGEAGSVAQVYVEPGQRAVTAIGVKIGRGPGGVLRAVSLDRVIDGTADEVRLSITREALLQVMTPAPAGATTLSHATQATINGRGSGALTQVSALHATGAITHLIVKQGLTGGEVVIEPEWIASISDDGSAIELALPSGAALAPHRPDPDLLDEVRARLWNYARLRVDLRAVDIRVIDGEVWIRGNVSSTLNRRIISDLLAGTRGLITLHNELVADNELAVRIAQALAKNPATHGQPIGVYPSLGKVYLRGLAHSPTVVEAAKKIAAEIEGQREVVSEMAVGAGPYIPMLAPVTGDEDIVPGGR